MATFERLQQNEKIETLSTVGADHSGFVGLLELSSEGGNVSHTTVITEDAYTESEWNDLPVGSHIWSLAAPGTQSWKTGATSWVSPSMS